jgi:carbon storage regulator
MLVLTRRSGQVIRIGESVTVTVVQLTRGRVRIGIDAPGAVPVHRGEIYERIQQENLAPVAAASSPSVDKCCVASRAS